jgi:hypothetical protein
MYERRCKKNSCPEMSRKEKEAMRYREAGKSAGYDREGTCYIKSASRSRCRKEHTDLACSI